MAHRHAEFVSASLVIDFQHLLLIIYDTIAVLPHPRCKLRRDVSCANIHIVILNLFQHLIIKLLNMQLFIFTNLNYLNVLLQLTT